MVLKKCIERTRMPRAKTRKRPCNDLSSMVYSRSTSNWKTEDLRQSLPEGNSIAGNVNNGIGRTNATSKPSIYPRKSSAPKIPRSLAAKRTAGHPGKSHRLGAAQRCHCQNYWRRSFDVLITSRSKSSTVSREYRLGSPHNSTG